MPWIGCRYCPSKGSVEWMNFEVAPDDEGNPVETATCFHHAREHGTAMVAVGWARITEAEWLVEESRLTGTL